VAEAGGDAGVCLLIMIAAGRETWPFVEAYWDLPEAPCLSLCRFTPGRRCRPKLGQSSGTGRGQPRLPLGVWWRPWWCWCFWRLKECVSSVCVIGPSCCRFAFGRAHHGER